MAHMMKLTRGALGGMFRHNERGDEDRLVTRSNESIDPTRTHLNYSLTPTPVLQLTPLERVNTLCENEGIHIAKRKDLNVAVSWVITAPKSITEDERERFFFECKRFLDTRYGYKDDKNVLCAQVHLDETSPHLHYVFCPVCYDSKNHRHTISAKNVVNRKDLQTFHKDLTEHMKGVFGRDIGIETGITEEQGGNMSVAELKAETKKNYAESKKALKGAQNERERIVSESKAKGQEIIGAAEKAATERLRASEGQAAEILRSAHALADSGEFPENVYQMGGVLSKKAVMPPETAEKMRKVANTAPYMRKKALKAEQENVSLKNVNEQLTAELNETNEQLRRANDDIKRLRANLQAYNRVFNEAYEQYEYDDDVTKCLHEMADNQQFYANCVHIAYEPKEHIHSSLMLALDERGLELRYDPTTDDFLCLSDKKDEVQALMNDYRAFVIRFPADFDEKDKVKVRKHCADSGIKADFKAGGGQSLVKIPYKDKDSLLGCIAELKALKSPQKPLWEQGQTQGRGV